MGDLGSIPGLGRSPGEGNGYPLQCTGLENSVDCIVHGVAKSGTRLSDFFQKVQFIVNKNKQIIIIMATVFIFISGYSEWLLGS